MPGKTTSLEVRKLVISNFCLYFQENINLLDMPKPIVNDIFQKY